MLQTLAGENTHSLCSFFSQASSNGLAALAVEPSDRPIDPDVSILGTWIPDDPCTCTGCVGLGIPCPWLTILKPGIEIQSFEETNTP